MDKDKDIVQAFSALKPEAESLDEALKRKGYLTFEHERLMYEALVLLHQAEAELKRYEKNQK